MTYGITSIAFSHNTWFNNGKGQPGGDWEAVESWPCSVEIPSQGDIPKETTRELLQIASLEAKAFGAFRSNANQIIVYLPSFTEMRQLLYRLDEGTLIMRERKKFPQQFLGGLPARGGYQHESFLDDSWAFLVDVVRVSFLLWMVTGLIIWWRSAKMRAWGVVALLSGFASFAGFMIWL